MQRPPPVFPTFLNSPAMTVFRVNADLNVVDYVRLRVLVHGRTNGHNQVINEL